MNKIKENKFIVYGTIALTLFMVIAHLNPSIASMIQLGGNKSTIYSPMEIPIGLIIGYYTYIPWAFKNNKIDRLDFDDIEWYKNVYLKKKLKENSITK